MIFGILGIPARNLVKIIGTSTFSAARTDDFAGKPGGRVNKGRRGIRRQFLTGAESPGHAYGADSGIYAGLHIHVRISDVDGFSLCHAGS